MVSSAIISLNHVVQIRTMGHVLQQRLVLLAQRYPIKAVHVRHVEPITISTPHFIEDLVPLFRRNAIDVQARQSKQPYDSFALRRCVVNLRPVPGTRAPSTIVRKCVTANVFDQRRFFAILDRVDAQRRSAITLATVVTSATNGVKQVSGLC